jgi:hydroxymethylpyrimidine/phosphomethylpyrimidine kinase
MATAARALVDLGTDVAMVKGGHLEGEQSPDCVWVSGASEPVWLEGTRIPGRHTHGTGCVLSAAITAELARGMEPGDACVAGKRFVERAIAGGLEIGAGVGPVNPGSERTASAP